MLLGFMLAAASPLLGSQDTLPESSQAPPGQPGVQEIKILPTQMPIPEGMVQIRSRGLRIPFAYGRIQRFSQEKSTWDLDEHGWMQRIESEVAYKLAAAPAGVEAFGAFEAPTFQPESRVLAGDWASVRLVPPNSEGPAPSVIHLCALTKAEKLITVQGARLFAVPDAQEWVLHFQESAALQSNEDPIEWICVRLDDPANDRVWTQIVRMSELRRGLPKELNSLSTVALTVDAKRAGTFGPMVEQQKLVALYPELHPSPLWLKSKALGAWLACPDDDLWQRDNAHTWRLEQVPDSVEAVHAYFSGTTTVTQEVQVRPHDSKDADSAPPVEVHLFGVPGAAGLPGHAIEWYEPTDPYLVAGIHESRIWGPTGNLFSGQVLGLAAEAEAEAELEGEDGNSGPWALTVPADWVYAWDLGHRLDDGKRYQRFFVAESNGLNPAGAEFNDSPRHQLRLRPTSPKVVLASAPSTEWEGPVKLMLVGHRFSGGRFQMHQESFEFQWPIDAGRVLDLQNSGADYDFWYAVSYLGTGTYGVFGSDLDSNDERFIGIDPSMDPGWSAVCLTRFGAGPAPYRAKVEARITGPDAPLEATWTAAAGAHIEGLGLGPVHRLANHFGFSLLSSTGLPFFLAVDVPGALQERSAIPPQANVIEIQIATQ